MTRGVDVGKVAPSIQCAESSATFMAPPRAHEAPPRGGAVGGGLPWACVGYLASVIALWLTLRFAADRWWVATVIMFGPRWVWALPLTLLLPAAVVLRRGTLLWPLSAAAVVVAGPVMGL